MAKKKKMKKKKERKGLEAQPKTVAVTMHIIFACACKSHWLWVAEGGDEDVEDEADGGDACRHG